MDARFGDPHKPLLFSLRSGAPVSRRGMKNTILHLGLNDEITEGLAHRTGNPRLAGVCSQRFIQMFANVLLDIESELFERKLEQCKAANGKQATST